MGEKQIKEIALNLSNGVDVKDLTNINGTCYLTSTLDGIDNYVLTPTNEEVIESKSKFAQAFKIQYHEQDPLRGQKVVQKSGDVFLVQNPPALPLTTSEMDEIYDLPYQRTYHPSYEELEWCTSY